MAWVGWTALYAIVVCGGYEVAYRLAARFAEGNSGVAAMGLVAAVGAFAVGVQFREVSWLFGPPAALALYVAAMIARLATEDYAGGGWAWFLFFSPGLLLPGAALSVFALAGVWWGRRRHAADAMPLGADPEDGAAAKDEAKGVLQHPLNPLSPQHTMTISPRKKKQSRPTPLPPRSLTSRFRAHAPQQCALSRRSRVTQVASEYPAMLRRSNLVSGGSVASARPLGTVRTLYTDI